MISNVQIYGLAESIQASKYPKAVDTEKCNQEITKTVKNLASAPPGSGHDNFLKGIIVQFDLRFTPKMSVELERYHFIDFVSSQSTMHKITKFDLDNSYIEYVDKRIVDIMKQKINIYNILLNDIDCATSDIVKKKLQEEATRLYLEILYSNPCGFLLTARLTTNYQQLKTIYRQRRFHRLPEWRDFCAWIETLPYAEDFICSDCFEEK